MEHVSTCSSWPMTLRAEGGPPRSQLKCHTSRPPCISHSKEECPCAADGNSGWVPTMVHSPTRISNCFIELVGCGGSFACSFMFITLMSSRVLTSAKHALRPHLLQEVLPSPRTKLSQGMNHILLIGQLRGNGLDRDRFPRSGSSGRVIQSHRVTSTYRG